MGVAAYYNARLIKNALFLNCFVQLGHMTFKFVLDVENEPQYTVTDFESLY